MSSRQLFGAVLISLALLPGAARGWWNDEWSARKPFKVDTSAAGAAINEPIGDAPLLVRLHAGNFKFESAKEDGSDLRFIAADEKTPLPFHVEKWDPLLGEALIWVAVPDLKPGTKTDLWLYSKNAKAVAVEDAKGTYDKATALAYHFTEKGQPPRDLTVWANHAITAGNASDGSLIGRGLRLDGSAEASVTLPAGASLNWVEGAKVTWSAWVKPLEAEGRGVIFSRREGPNALIIGVDGGKPFVQVETVEGVKQEAGATAIPAASWHHLAITGGDAITLYVDAVPVAKLAARIPALAGTAVIGLDPRGETRPAVLPPVKPAKGAKAAKLAAVVELPLPGFKGELDELQIAKVERTEGFLKFAVASQGTDPSKLLVPGQEEETAGMGSGYLAVILRSVTLDGWVIIGLLGVMAVISGWVMVTKAAYLSAVERANEAFSRAFHAYEGSLVELINQEQGTAELGAPKVLAGSSLYRLYRVGADEIRKRTRNGQDLSAHAVESIRATMDSGLVREGQRLNSQLVLLTIAISGGPFLGLLGTVVGVMITFAAIAAAGDVNVNAIAPGIAAALVATVAGLAVAIPNLFGYNWLLTRIKNVVALQQVFVDEFITNAVEAHYQHESRQTSGVLPRRMAAEKVE